MALPRDVQIADQRQDDEGGHEHHGGDQQGFIDHRGQPDAQRGRLRGGGLVLQGDGFYSGFWHSVAGFIFSREERCIS